MEHQLKREPDRPKEHHLHPEYASHIHRANDKIITEINSSDAEVMIAEATYGLRTGCVGAQLGAQPAVHSYYPESGGASS